MRCGAGRLNFYSFYCSSSSSCKRLVQITVGKVLDTFNVSHLPLIADYSVLCRMIPHFPFTARLSEIGRVSTKAKRLKTNKKYEILNDRLIPNDLGSQLSRLIIHCIFPREIYRLIASSVS